MKLNRMKIMILMLMVIMSAAQAVVAQNMPPAPRTDRSRNEPSGPNFAENIRLSGIIRGNNNNIMVGLINTTANWNVIRPVGGRYGDIEIVSADYEKEVVRLRCGEHEATLKLEGDENMPKIFFAGIKDDDPSTWPPGFKGPGIERFLQENPNAVIKLPFAPKPPDHPVKVEGLGPGIEAALKDNPELAAKVRQPLPPGSKGEGIEAFIKAHPELVIPNTNMPMPMPPPMPATDGTAPSTAPAMPTPTAP